MQKTYQASVLSVSGEDSTTQVLEAFRKYYGAIKRALYREVATRGGKCKDYKVEFCAKYELTARQFNALAVDLQGAIDAVVALLKQDAKYLPKQLKNKKAMLKRAQEQMSAVEADTLRLSKKKRKALKFRSYNIGKDIARLESLIKRVKARLKANVPGICFGSRKRFKAQFHLKESGFETHEQWLDAWRASRDHQFFFIGSKDETAGNQSCVLTVTELPGPPTKKALIGLEADALKVFKARIRTPNAFRNEKSKHYCKAASKHKYVEVYFKLGHGQAQVLDALANGRALSYRFHYCLKAQQWYVYISTDVPNAKVQTVSRQYGVLGVDFNADHLAVSVTNQHGNLLKGKSFRVDLPVEGKSTQCREDLLSCALDRVVAYAVERKLPIAAEELDFEAKKANMSRKSKKYKVMLSSLMYSKYQELLASKCAKAGVELIKVNPAYTSMAGRIKYTLPYGQSVHLAAAGAIARRAQGFREKAPTVARVATGPVVSELVLPVRNRTLSTHSRWRMLSKILRKTLQRVISEQKLRDKHRFKYRQQSSA